MDLIATVGAWTAAWAARDAEAAAGAVGTFTDPDTPEPVSGDGLAAHLTAMFARFPDLTLEFATPADAGDTVVVSWTLAGTQRGGYLGIPGTGGQAGVSGVDVCTLVDGVVHVRRHFDRVALAASLGYTPRFVPGSDDVQEYGFAARTTSAKHTLPGAITLTWLDFRDDAESTELDLLSIEVVRSLRASRGFLGTSNLEIGNRKYTLTAFDKPESIRAVHARPHQRAMRRFFRGGLCTGAYTSVWTLDRQSVYLRCPDCASMVEASEEKPCDCGAVLTIPPLF
jgi:predicted ester cyclase